MMMKYSVQDMTLQYRVCFQLNVLELMGDDKSWACCVYTYLTSNYSDHTTFDLFHCKMPI